MPTDQSNVFNTPSENIINPAFGDLKSEPMRQMTFGEQLVAIKFNPSNDDKVSKAKNLCAELMDLVQSEFATRETSTLSNILYNHTVGEILNAQMNVVKLLTLKY